MKLPLTLLSRTLLAVLLFLGLSLTVRAENKKKEEAIITEISPLSMTVSSGHDVHVRYTIPKDSIISFNGLPADVHDLRAGMMVTVRADATGKIALAIRAHNPPK